MADFVRRLVSGKKARFKDGELDLELDLAYITDRVIVMGYPASGVEGFYRNRREDAKKFLEHRHGKNYWVFNFCPVKENSYSADVFDGRVSRYPFPDHHAPPLAILSLVAREMRTWLDGSQERVAVLHCKAGKGRSGTLACSYLLTLTDAPRPPNPQSSRIVKDRAKEHAEALMNEMPADETINAEIQSSEPSKPSGDPIKEEIPSSSTTTSKSELPVAKSTDKTAANTLEHVLNLHTSTRMKRSDSPSAQVKPGVSIPSQRRWLYYWSLLIAHQGPPGFWSLDPTDREPAPKVRLTQIKLRMKELSGVKVNLLKAANALIDRAGKGKAMELEATKHGKSQMWVSLARYDDELVEALEEWERQTRSDDGDMGKRKQGSDHMDEEHLAGMFSSDKWDRGKMVRSFARLGVYGDNALRTEESEEYGKVITHVLRPLTGDRWNRVRNKIKDVEEVKSPVVESEEASINDLTHTLDTPDGVVLDANREIRAKLYMGQVFMGWLWFIPTFHMAHPRSSAKEPTILHLTRKEVDFPLGIGSHIIDLEVSMEWCSEHADVVSPPERQGSQESAEGKGEPAGIATALEALAIGEVDEVVEAAQAAED